jgi:RecA/RadA recombinase
MSSLLERMLKSGAIKSKTVAKSDFFNDKDVVPTGIPILDVAFSGKLDGGLVSGLTVIAGKSKTFKSLLSLVCMKSYLNKHPDAIALFYDSEFGITGDYLKSIGIDPERVVHIEIEDVEQLKFDIVNRLNDIEKDDKVFIMIDSIGNLASKKEIEDAENEKSVADMTRAKSLKSLFRIITPKLVTRNVPCIAINHVYDSMELYSKAIVSGGCVVAGTEIQTPEGLKRIEDFKPGDVVLTNYGENIISHVWDPKTLEEGNPECYEITLDDGHTVVCSETHKFLVDGNWISAKDLIVGMECETIKT